MTKIMYATIFIVCLIGLINTTIGFKNLTIAYIDYVWHSVKYKYHLGEPS